MCFAALFLVRPCDFLLMFLGHHHKASPTRIRGREKRYPSQPASRGFTEALNKMHIWFVCSTGRQLNCLILTYSILAIRQWRIFVDGSLLLTMKKRQCLDWWISSWPSGSCFQQQRP